MIKIALYETITPGNIGAVARAMKNFGFKELLLIKPKCNYKSEEVFQRACHASNIVNNIKVISDEELFNNFVIGTTSKAFTRKAHRQPAIASKLDFIPENAVILFGREDNGLTNELLNKCNSLITIPTGTDYQSLNLSHAVTIILYELSKKSINKKLINIKLKAKILETLNELSNKLSRNESLKGFFKNIINRSIIYEKEGKALMGFLKELKKKIT